MSRLRRALLLAPLETTLRQLTLRLAVIQSDECQCRDEVVAIGAQWQAIFYHLTPKTTLRFEILRLLTRLHQRR